jgi:hypothetical protein
VKGHLELAGYSAASRSCCAASALIGHGTTGLALAVCPGIATFLPPSSFLIFSRRRNDSGQQPATEHASLRSFATLTAALSTRPKCRKSVPAATNADLRRSEDLPANQRGPAGLGSPLFPCRRGVLVRPPALPTSAVSLHCSILSSLCSTPRPDDHGALAAQDLGRLLASTSACLFQLQPCAIATVIAARCIHHRSTPYRHHDRHADGQRHGLCASRTAAAAE